MTVMLDVLAVIGLLVFGLLTLALVKACEKLGRNQP